MLIETAAYAQELSAATERIADVVGLFILAIAHADTRWRALRVSGRRRVSSLVSGVARVDSVVCYEACVQLKTQNGSQ